MATPVEISLKHLPIVAIIGRTNVGKSTLFNRFIEEKKAMTSPVAGTTRTANSGIVLWRGREFRLVDTGGLSFDEKVPLEQEILTQTKEIAEIADVLLFVVDATTGLMPQEKELISTVRKMKRRVPVIFLANKVDNERIEKRLDDPEWLRMGLGKPIPCSAVNGRNVGDIIDVVFRNLKKTDRKPQLFKETDKEKINVTIIGKPNVGKSSIFNQIIGEPRAIVSDMAHTTREPYDTLVTYTSESGDKTKKILFNFIDTAGIRRKTKVSGDLERTGISRSIQAIADSEIVLFVIDLTDPFSIQDRQLGGLFEKHAKSVIILVNKWDLAIDNSDLARNELKKQIYSYYPHLYFAPILFVSGLSGYRTHQTLPLLEQVAEARRTMVPDEAIRKFMLRMIRLHKPVKGKGSRMPEILGMQQIATNPPVFEMLIKEKTSLHRSYLNFIEKHMREEFNFLGTPIIIKLTKMKR
ncbi:MAG TPA: ribosome biogenesis GTPase Der [Candidatus Magasanikbacteria bacterium]|nr:ribosome biogenesis GTPase Der [Candidatus Magasanikbacteria bacterium]